MAPLVLLLSTLFFSLCLCYLFFSKSKRSNRGHYPPPPGPKGWLILGNLLQLGTKPHQTLCSLSKNYGLLFHLHFGSVDMVVAASTDVAAQFLRAHNANFSNRPPNCGAEHISYNYQNLFTAGTDTSSSTVEWALAELIRRPEILKKAQTELDSVVGSNRLISETDLPNFPFLQAIIKETFRLHPSTPLSLPRISSEACEVNGYHIPQNTTLLVNIWAISRDPAIWANPLEFRPDRFLPGGGYENIDVKGNDFEIIPFGAGRRICAGLSLGLRMVQFVVATLIHAFDWTWPAGQIAEKLDMEEAYGLTLQRAVPLMVHTVPRLGPKAYQDGC